ncbi:Ribonuclease D [Thioalkalivibrio nitratireducens DSM 14787]|uniref:Ribonuclease D n=1 Tax=Thioalkalivibrio nitratireducens (strain DSM 14787 / UNIQEM 213 / ALEN2) TaxID=1255043 RepID=L0E103_THIND|nr:ribonuclease D [Thioalkalivibrio nitratireducens]AGA34331.1 Ribonuclease D [Thioalkalivibrio nitratireducens DSM 14787]
MHDHGLITTETGLRALLDAIAGSEWVAMDTEFIREKTYFPKLCLIQLATPDHIACVDPLALGGIGQLDQLLQDSAVLKVFHAASQDLEVLYLVTGKVASPVFDTQVAASLLGHGEQVGYANLVEAVLHRELDKTQSRTDWARRPLQPAQLEYARDDVRFLTELFVQLQKELDALGRLDWLQPEMEALTRPEQYRPDPARAWLRVSGHKRLKPRDLAVLRELAAWRETEARDLDRPRRWVISDDALLTIARTRPADLQTLHAQRGLPRNLDEQRARQILEAVQQGCAAPKESWPAVSRRQPLSEAEEVVADVCMALLRELARRQKISPQAIASRKDVMALMRREDGATLAQGWRARVAGAQLQRWLDGASALRRSSSGIELDR